MNTIDNLTGTDVDQSLSNANITHNFLQSVNKFISGRTYHDRIPDIIEGGLNIFLQLPAAESVSLFLLNENNSDFEYRITFPYSYKSEAEPLFNKLVYSGQIGTSLQSAESVIVDLSNQPDSPASCMIIPLAVASGIVGIVILKFTSAGVRFDNLLSNLVSMHGNQFAVALENSLYIKRVHKAYSTLEQEIAARTMDLRQSRRELATILDSVQAGILICDCKTNEIVKANPVALQLLGGKEQEIIGSDITKFLETGKNASSGDFSSRSSVDMKSELRTLEGNTLPVLRSFNTIGLGLNKVRIESFLDITELNQAQNELCRANEMLELKVEERTIDLQYMVHKLKEEIAIREQAEKEAKRMLEKEKELSELKTRFVSMVSHEFRTPLTVIKSSAQMLTRFKDKFTEEENSSHLRRIVKTVDIMTDLIENVVFMGKKDNNTKIRLIDINADEFFNSIIYDMKLAFGRSRVINFQNNFAYKTIKSDEKLLRLIVVNLVSNALKYSHESTSVDISLSFDLSYFVIKILDHGIGIPAEQQEMIFNMFYRADNVGQISGTGLGLSVVMQSLEMLNGKIDLKSAAGEGTAFTVYIPLNQEAR